MLAAAASDVVETGPDLLDRCVAGNPAAWRGAHPRYRRSAPAVLRPLGLPPGRLEGAGQDVFVDVFRCLPRCRREADVRTWHAASRWLGGTPKRRSTESAE